MKEKIHPKTEKVEIKCACGNVINTTSTATKGYTIEICAACHPFFTGKQKLIDSAGKVEKFKRKYEKFEKRTKKQ